MKVLLKTILVLLTVQFNTIASGMEIEVTDDLGRKLILRQTAKRIVSLAPHITENLFAAGAGKLIVGVDSYSDYPKQVKSIPKVGSYNNIDVETILAMDPDLIIAWYSGAGWSLGAVAWRAIRRPGDRGRRPVRRRARRRRAQPVARRT